MCANSGCSTEPYILHDGAGREQAHVLTLERRVLARNDQAAARNRTEFSEAGVLALNLLGSPGAGKTTLIERTVRELGRGLELTVIEGDQETELDAERIRAAGGRAVQINTGAGCHLDAEMTGRALRELAPARGSVVLIENVGSLVCPALFDLGERTKVVLLSVTEGDDKPLKYPYAFRGASLLLVSKTDLLPHVSFDLARCAANARRVNPSLEILAVSCAKPGGLDAWYRWLRLKRS